MAEHYTIHGRIDIKIEVEGQEVDCSAGLVSVETMCGIGKIASATVVLQDDPSSLALSDSDDFSIGKKMDISIGRDMDLGKIFSGVIIEKSLRMEQGGTEAVVKARHEAFRMTLERHFLCHEDKTDSELISEMAGDYGISAEVGDTKVRHEKLVQYNCSDWDFINMRAESAGLLLCTLPSGITAVAPDLSSEPVIKISNGYSLNKIQIRLNGRDRFKSVAAKAWNYSSGRMDSSEVPAGDYDTGQGTEKTCDLASKVGNTTRTVHLLSGQASPDAMEQFNASQTARLDLSRITGKLSAQGNNAVFPTDMVLLEGVGKCFDGSAFVSSVIQKYAESDWETTLGIGIQNVPFSLKYRDIDAEAADGAVPASYGLQIAVVEAIEGDPAGEERIKVKLMGYDTASVWARVALPDAGKERGCVFMPEVGDEVVVGFIGANPSESVVLGMFHNGSAASPFEKSDSNDIKGIVTREKLRLEFDDGKKNITIQTPGGNTIILSDDDGNVHIEDQNGNKVTLDSGGIIIDSAKDIALKAKGDLNLQGTNINLKADAQLAAKGSGSAEISSSGNTVVKGSIVQIN